MQAFFHIRCTWVMLAFALMLGLGVHLSGCSSTPEETPSQTTAAQRTPQETAAPLDPAIPGTTSQSPASDDASYFSDVPADHRNAEAINTLTRQGLASGYPDGSFRPDDPVLWRDFAEMVVLGMGFGSRADGRYVDELIRHGLGGGRAEVADSDEVTGEDLLLTAARMSAPLLEESPETWQEPGAGDEAPVALMIRRLTSAGLLSEVGEIQRRPQEAASRGEAAQFLHNLLLRTAGLPPLSIANYGARNDGPGDDTAAVQAAIDACPEGGSVTMPAGTFSIGEVELKSHMTLSGSGTSTVLMSGGLHPLSIEGKHNVTVTDFSMRGSYSLFGQAGIFLTAGANSRITIQGLSISDMGFCGIYLSDTGTMDDSIISDSTITHCGDFGIASRGGGSRLSIENCVLSDFAGTSYPPHGIYFHNMDDLTIKNCEVFDLGHHPNAYSGLELNNCLRALVEDCYMHDIRVGTHDDGYGYVAVGITSVTYRRCRGGGNYYDFYEYALTGGATYEDSPGTRRIVDDG